MSRQAEPPGIPPGTPLLQTRGPVLSSPETGLQEQELWGPSCPRAFSPRPPVFASDWSARLLGTVLSCSLLSGDPGHGWFLETDTRGLPVS